MLCQWMLYYPQKETAKEKRERDLRKGLFGKDCLEIEFVALSYAAGFLCSSLVSLFLCEVLCVVLINNFKIREGAA